MQFFTRVYTQKPIRTTLWCDWNRADEEMHIRRSIWHRHEGSPKTAQSVGLVAVSAELREILLALWCKQGSPLDGYILAGKKGRPIILDNLAKRSIRDRLNELNKDAAEGEELTWPGWYSLRRFHGTAVREQSNLETTSKALRNSKAVADKHYVKPESVLPDVRKAVTAAVAGLA